MLRQDAGVAALVARVRNGDADALNQVTRRYRPGIAAFLAEFAGEAAEDLTQQVFINLPRSLAGYEESGRFVPWLRTVAYNVYRTWARSQVRQGLETLPTGVPANSSTTTLFATDKQRLRELVPRLPDGERQAWELYAVGHPPREIGSRLGISAGAAATRVSRAKDALTALILEELGRQRQPK